MSVKDLREVEISPAMRDVVEWFCLERGIEAVYAKSAVFFWRWDEAQDGYRLLGRMRLEAANSTGKYWDLEGVADADGRRASYAYGYRQLDLMLHVAWEDRWGR